MDFEKGEFYITRGGKRVECVQVNQLTRGALFVYDRHGEKEEWFAVHRTGCHKEGATSAYDIMSERDDVHAEETAPSSSDDERERIISLIQGFGRVAVIANPRLYRQFTAFVDGLVKHIRMMT